MNTLLETHDFLTRALQTDPVLSIAQTVAYLDPLAVDAELPLPDDDGTLTDALHITRENFPDVYSDAITALRQGAPFATIDKLICNALTDRGIPVDNIEFIGFGIPMPAYGAELADPEFHATHPEYEPVLALFGISCEPNPYTIDVPDCATNAGYHIAHSLTNDDNLDYQHVGWMLGWLFSCTVNRLPAS